MLYNIGYYTSKETVTIQPGLTSSYSILPPYIFATSSGSTLEFQAINSANQIV